MNILSKATSITRSSFYYWEELFMELKHLTITDSNCFIASPDIFEDDLVTTNPSNICLPLNILPGAYTLEAFSTDDSVYSKDNKKIEVLFRHQNFDVFSCETSLLGTLELPYPQVIFDSMGNSKNWIKDYQADVIGFDFYGVGSEKIFAILKEMEFEVECISEDYYTVYCSCESSIYGENFVDYLNTVNKTLVSTETRRNSTHENLWLKLKSNGNLLTDHKGTVMKNLNDESVRSYEIIGYKNISGELCGFSLQQTVAAPDVTSKEYFQTDDITIKSGDYLLGNVHLFFDVEKYPDASLKLSMAPGNYQVQYFNTSQSTEIEGDCDRTECTHNELSLVLTDDNVLEFEEIHLCEIKIEDSITFDKVQYIEKIKKQTASQFLQEQYVDYWNRFSKGKVYRKSNDSFIKNTLFSEETYSVFVRYNRIGQIVSIVIKFIALAER